MGLINLILHLDQSLSMVIQQFGGWTYVLLFLIVFCETGLVVTPFLPGDSLLFAIGAFCGSGLLELSTSLVILLVAAVLGDAVNYSVGNFLGQKVFDWNSKWIKKEYLTKTQKFYDKYGGKTIVLARFVPIIRTFAPFLAGVGKMNYFRFALFNVTGGVVWVLSLVLAGYFFGNMEIVKNNFSLVILGIIFVSILPGVIEFIRIKLLPAKVNS